MNHLLFHHLWRIWSGFSGNLEVNLMDMILVLRKLPINGKKFIVLIELKTGFCSGIGKGRSQLMASGFKILTF